MGELGAPNAQNYSKTYVDLYHDLQLKQQRVHEARSAVQQLGNPHTLERFDAASQAYSFWRAGTRTREEAAFAMRTLLDGIKGDLWQIARMKPGEDMTWHKMAERLAKNGPNGAECATVKTHDSTRSILVESLSVVAKDREGKSVADLNSIWTQVLDHIYAVLSLLNLSST